MKKRVTLLVALCIWKVVAAQTPYGEMPERFRPDTLPCRLGGGVCFGMDGLDAAIPRGGGASSCRDPRVVFVAGDTLITFISVAGVADTALGNPVCRFYGRNVARVVSRTRRMTGGRMGAADNDFPDDPDFAELQGVVIENQRYPWESYAAGDSAYRLPVVRSLVGGKEDPLLGSDMRRRYVRLLTEVSVELKAGGTRPFVHVVYLLPDP